MKYFFSLILITLTLNISAQNKKAATDDGYAVIKGHITNPQKNYWGYMANSFIGYKSVSVPIDKNGDFSTKVKIEGTYTDILIQLAHASFLYLQKNDTITINWDTQNITGILPLKASKPEREHDLKTNIAITDFYMSSINGLHEFLYQEKLPDSVKFSKVNQLYNKIIDMIAAGNCSKEGQFKMATDIYFRCASLLFDNDLLKKYDLFIEHPTPDLNGTTYRIESEVYFKSSSDYRNFIYDYVRLDTPFSVWGPTDNSNRAVSNPALNTCYSGFLAFHMYEVRDWYLTKVIMSYFGSISFKEASEAYSQFLPQIKTPYYIDTLKKFYAGINSLKPGTPAPNFILKNEAGKLVSLSSFKGKVVYLDFWGTKCGPCIEEITNNSPALYSKYKDKNIVFINICVDADEEEWKAGLAKLNMEGINLIAEGWTKNPVCKAYNISGLPHYCLIDKEGKIADANSPRPGQQFQLHTKIDALLK